MFEGYLRKFLRNQHQNHTMCLTHLFEISTHLAPHVYYTRSTTRLGFVGLEDSWPFEPNVLAKRTPQESSMPTFEVGLGGVQGGGKGRGVFSWNDFVKKKMRASRLQREEFSWWRCRNDDDFLWWWMFRLITNGIFLLGIFNGKKSAGRIELGA